MKSISEIELLGKLKKEIEKFESQKAFAAHHKLSAAWLSDVLNGRRDINEKVAGILGYKRKVVFEKIAEK